MNSSYAYFTGRRAWYVPGVSVWGDLTGATLDTIAAEVDDTATRVVFQRFGLGGLIQEIRFDALTDHRGNLLPSVIDRPVVIIITRNAVPVALVGRPTDVAFRLARTAAAAEDGLVDLWIVEART